jgi:Uma2 family endonuclease
MSEPVRIEESAYTYADYLEWNDGKRYELIDGKAYMMASPSTAHQIISGELFGQFWNFLGGKTCRVFSAPFDVRLFPQKNLSDDTVVQPDLLVVCDKTKLDQRGCNGAPDLVIEILSPSNNYSEMFHKFQKYLEARVREYWIINPETQVVQAHILENGHYISTVYQNDDVIPVSILPGFSIDLKTIWSALL